MPVRNWSIDYGFCCGCLFGGRGVVFLWGSVFLLRLFVSFMFFLVFVCCCWGGGLCVCVCVFFICLFVSFCLFFCFVLFCFVCFSLCLIWRNVYEVPISALCSTEKKVCASLLTQVEDNCLNKINGHSAQYLKLWKKIRRRKNVSQNQWTGLRIHIAYIMALVFAKCTVLSFCCTEAVVSVICTTVSYFHIYRLFRCRLYWTIWSESARFCKYVYG